MLTNEHEGPQNDLCTLRMISMHTKVPGSTTYDQGQHHVS